MLPKINLTKRPILKGTLILTATGLTTRLIGFFYRIYLSQLFGEEGMGIYQLLSPVLALTFSLCAAGYQTAISKFVAEYPAQDRSVLCTFFCGLFCSIPLSFICTAVLYKYADPIACNLLQESQTAPMLRIFAFSIPLSSIHACINGYFYGRKQTLPPALAQLLEQLSRVSSVYLITGYCLSHGRAPSINVAVLGLAIGEFMSMCVCILAILYAGQNLTTNSDRPATTKLLKPLLPLLSMALPLTLNRIVLNILQSIEAVSIPNSLRLYGLDSQSALRIYGVLTGMAMPMIFFPNALINSVSVLLLPVISESYAKKDYCSVRSSIRRTLRFCYITGLCCMSGFLILGNYIGRFFFDSALAGRFITTLSFLCPFMYLDMTLSSVLQGLGRAGTIFCLNVTALLIRLGFVLYAIPRFGITGYLWGILTSQILLSILYLIVLQLQLQKNMSAHKNA